MRRRLAVLLLLFGLSTVASNLLQVSSHAAANMPNFVVIVVDDLDSASVSRMPAVNRQLVDQGATFSRFFVTTPLCCPSRASILRGQYAHNHGVLRNTGEDAGFDAFSASGDEAETIATALQGSGYETALVGKYLNGYAYPRNANTYIPPGWDYWVAGVDHAAYANFNYDLNVNGQVVHHGNDDRDYMTDVLAAHALDFLDGSAASNQPFFLYLAPYAPHSPSTPAPRHRGMFAGETAPRGPAFNERNIQDKPDWVQSSRLTDERISRIDSTYRDRLESLMAVDEMVDVVVRRLEEQGTLSSTYILFLSDNGYFMGEHRQPHGKDAPYDAASKVPLIVRGPGVAAGSSVKELALNIDLYPTVAELSGIPTPSFVDGRSIAPLLTGSSNGWRQVALLEGFGKETESNEGTEAPTPPFQALRSEDILYAEYETGEKELYDLRKDPDQLSNFARDAPNSLLREYSRRLNALATCAASECAFLENEPLPGRAHERAQKGESRGKGKKKNHDHGKSKGTGKRNENRGKRRNIRQEVEPTVRKNDSQTSLPDPRLLIGGPRHSTAEFQLDVPGGALSEATVALRIHIKSVATAGSLIAVLTSTESASGTILRNARERLGSEENIRKGWITFDVKPQVGDATKVTITLRGRDGGEFAVSGTDSENAPQLVSGATGTESTRSHRRQTRNAKP